MAIAYIGRGARYSEQLPKESAWISVSLWEYTMIHEQLTVKIIGCAIKVSNTFDCGFLEKVYENALAHELRKAGLQVQTQFPITVHYDGVLVGDYYADIVVEGTVILELKAISAFDKIHTAQCINYLKATGKKICLLLNFGKPRLEFKRIILNGQPQ
jgi:GxxExxY protein